MDILFRGVTLIPMTENGAAVLSPVDVGVSDGRIAYVGEENHSRAKAARVIDGRDKVLIPGLINCHTHTPMSLLRGFAGDLALNEWLFDYILPAEKKVTDEMLYYGSLLSMAEMAGSGTVSCSDMYFGLDMIAKAAAEAGIKINLSNAVVALNEDYQFETDKCCSESVHVLRQYQNACEGRIKVDAAIHAEYTSFDRAWQQTVAFAQDRGLNMHIHLSETKREHEDCKKKYGCTPTQILARHGVFDMPTTAAHCVWVEEEDINVLAEKKVTVAHNPVSNMKLASGAAPISRMMQKGVAVALGTDGMASNNSHDLFEEMKLTCLLQKNCLLDPTAVPAYEALKMATVNGAAAQGRQKESGRILPGYEADLTLLDFHSPRLTVNRDTVSNVVYACTGRDVCLTMCRGKILYENGEYKTIDIEKAMAEAKRLTQKIFGL